MDDVRSIGIITHVIESLSKKEYNLYERLSKDDLRIVTAIRDVVFQQSEQKEIVQRNFHSYQEHIKISCKGHYNYGYFKKTCDAIFFDEDDININWGRIIAIFYFGRLLVDSRICTEEVTISYINNYITTELKYWINENGGWDRLGEIYGNPKERMFPWVVALALGITVVSLPIIKIFRCVCRRSASNVIELSKNCIIKGFKR